MTFAPSHWLFETFSIEYWKERSLLPIFKGDKLEKIAFSVESDLNDLNRFRFVSRQSYALATAPSSKIIEGLELLESELASGSSKSANGTNGASAKPVNEVSSSVVSQVNEIISEAVRLAASDIHFEPFEDYLMVRYRIDGSLREIQRLEAGLKPPTLSRLKIMGGLDIAERRLPQDGRIRFHVDGKMIDLRLSTLPTEFGEKAVLRILDKSALRLDLNTLGMNDSPLASFRRNLSRSNGIILVTGPTGSGKTTTLYSALNEISAPELNITTIEDPIEYNLEGINQTQIKPVIGFDFAQVLRSTLRQDPNVIMVGEIRDQETLSISLRAALTGHLVLSTLHTNDSVAAITRLLDLGAERGLLASALRLVIAQRLVRTLCDKCKERVSGASDGSLELDTFKPVGCESCFGSGYSGRRAVFEFLEITPAFAEALETDAPIAELRRLARQEGLIELQAAGMELVRSGQTITSQIAKEIG